jgi:hypothetical protein
MGRVDQVEKERTESGTGLASFRENVMEAASSAISQGREELLGELNERLVAAGLSTAEPRPGRMQMSPEAPDYAQPPLRTVMSGADAKFAATATPSSVEKEKQLQLKMDLLQARAKIRKRASRGLFTPTAYLLEPSADMPSADIPSPGPQPADVPPPAEVSNPSENPSTISTHTQPFDVTETTPLVNDYYKGYLGFTLQAKVLERRPQPTDHSHGSAGPEHILLRIAQPSGGSGWTEENARTSP